MIWYGGEPGKTPSTYIQEVPDGLPRPVLKEGLLPNPRALSPDGAAVSCQDQNGAWSVCPLDGAAPKSLPGVASSERVFSWTPDGRFVYAFDGRTLPINIFRVEVATGRRTLWTAITPSDPAGLNGAVVPLIAPDGQTIAYTLRRVLGDLYLVPGVK